MKQLTVSAKLTVLIVCAMLFGATMIALSIRHKAVQVTEGEDWGKDKKIEKTFSVQPDGKLIIDSDEGNISIVGTDNSEVSVRVLARGSDEHLRKFDVSLDQEGNTIRVIGKVARRHFSLWSNFSLDVDFEVRVPKKFNLDLHTAGGNIIVDNVKGKVDGETSGGDLELSGLEGNVRLNTSGGNVTLHEATGDFFLETSGGNVNVRKN